MPRAVSLWALGATCLVSLALTGCARDSPDEHRATPGGDITYDGPLATTLLIRDAGLTLNPPAGRTPTVSAADAASTCATGESWCDTDPATTFLASATLSPSAPASPVGSPRPSLTSTLVYAMVWTHTRCAARPTGVASYGCTSVSLVDAETGAFLYAYTGAGS